MNIANRILEEVYFITITVVDWGDIFTCPKYKHIILDSLAYCQQKKGLKIYAWVLMSNHLHMLVSVGLGHTVADVVRDFKKFPPYFFSLSFIRQTFFIKMMHAVHFNAEGLSFL